MNSIQTYDISYQYLSFFEIFIYFRYNSFCKLQKSGIIKIYFSLRHTCKSHSLYYTIRMYNYFIKFQQSYNYHSTLQPINTPNITKYSYLMISNIIKNNLFKLITSKHETLSFMIIKNIFEEKDISYNKNFLQTLAEWLCNNGFINIIKYTFENEYLSEQHFSANFYKAFSLACKNDINLVKYIYETIFQNKINFEKINSYTCLHAIENDNIEVLQYLYETIGFEIDNFRCAIKNKYNIINKEIFFYLIKEVELTPKDFQHCKELYNLILNYLNS